MNSFDNWKPIKLSKLGTIDSGRDIYAVERIDGRTPYITSGSQKNGIGYFVGNNNGTFDRDYISINRNGSVGLAFYHPYWSLMGNDCRKLHLFDVKNNINVGIFVATSISMQSKSFSYSRKLGTERANRLQIVLPLANDGVPRYDKMHEYVQFEVSFLLKKYRKYAERRVSFIGYKNISSLSEKEWKEFSVDELFTVSAGKRLETRNKTSGDRPFIGATDNGNGITGFVGNDNASKDSNVLGVNYNGAPCIAFYHPYECIFTDDVKRLHLKNYNDNEFVLLFFVAIFAKQRKKYSYGYKFNEQRMLRQKLMLPVNDNNEPDYAYMEQYAKNMMYRKYQQYLTYLDKKQQ